MKKDWKEDIDNILCHFPDEGAPMYDHTYKATVKHLLMILFKYADMHMTDVNQYESFVKMVSEHIDLYLSNDPVWEYDENAPEWKDMPKPRVYEYYDKMSEEYVKCYNT